MLSLTVMSEAGRTHQALLFLPPSTSLLDTINFSTGPQIRPVSPKGIRATTSGSDQIFNTSLRGDKIHVLLVACQSGVNYPKSAINQLVLYYAQPASLNTSTADAAFISLGIRIFLVKYSQRTDLDFDAGDERETGRFC